MTKPIIVVTICYKLLYVIQVVKKTFDISNFLASTDIKVFGSYIPICNAASDWPRTFFTPRVFLFSTFNNHRGHTTFSQHFWHH